MAAPYLDGEGGASQTRTWQRSSGVSFGDVSAGTINNAGRDIHHSYDHRRHYEITTPEG
ncbi:hypothetical protein H4696_001491 [Amycolatopsis lexingtonensis]|uniref:Uncharacterized protein n=1 Tax=Amycolatopsis lexingtonensis TaxID=218822 RepID=A0ABR9HTZ5_9PSEU|nr:hypothetical protein [Amycolatopsis lexingtonensis]MBE1494391.1 hypothetical protein [Amycolatopsis lexingtonensis]